jgi:hypothetical protein
MRYYSNSIDGGSSVNDSRIIQALMVYVYADRVELKMKNYGESGTINGITINKDLTPYVSYRIVEHSTEVVTETPTIATNVTGETLQLGNPIRIELTIPEWRNIYYTSDGSTPTEESMKAKNGIIQWYPEATGEYVVKIAAQEGIKLLSQSIESPKFVVVEPIPMMVSPSNEESLDSISQFTVTCPKGITIAEEKFKATFSNQKDYNVDLTAKQLNDTTIVLTLPEAPKEAGSYTLQIVAKSFILSPDDIKLASDDVSITYNIVVNNTAINSIEVAGGNIIYSITGKVISNDAKTLKKGIYIVNGKKIIIK